MLVNVSVVPSDMVLYVFLSWSDVSAGHSDLGSYISAKEDLQGR